MTIRNRRGEAWRSGSQLAQRKISRVRTSHARTLTIGARIINLGDRLRTPNDQQAPKGKARINHCRPHFAVISGRKAPAPAPGLRLRSPDRHTSRAHRGCPDRSAPGVPVLKARGHRIARTKMLEGILSI
jgi:hypothetical protein